MPETQSSLTRMEPAIVGMIDIVSSTAQIMGDLRRGHAERAQLMVNVVDVMGRELSDWVKVVSFTGDGLLFYVTGTTNGLLQKMQALRWTIDATCTVHLHLRVALAAGIVFRGKVGPTMNIVGVPVVEAARLLQEKSFFTEGVGIVATSGAVNVGDSVLWRRRDWNSISSFWVPAGLGPSQVEVFCYNCR